MSGFNPDSRLKIWADVLSGASSNDATLTSKVYVDEGPLKTFVEGLRELPTSFLQVALDCSDSTVLTKTQLRTEIVDRIKVNIDASQQGELLPNRAVIDSVCGEGLRTSRTRMERINLLEVAGQQLEQAMLDLAADHKLGTDFESTDTVRSSDRTTLNFAKTNPDKLRNRSDRLARLSEHDPLLARIYVLFEYAGRTHVEIAELLDMPLADVVHSENVATVEVCMEE